MTATLPTYEGWANRPTWSVNLWLTNDRYTDSELRRICNRGSAYEAAQALQEFVEEMMDDTLSGSSLQSDLLSWALAYVDWREIVENNREEEEEEEEETLFCATCGAEYNASVGYFDDCAQGGETA